MKKYSILLLLVLLAMGMNFSSCRSCKGGGWYGDRNLGYAPQKEQPAEKQKAILNIEEESCDITAP